MSATFLCHQWPRRLCHPHYWAHVPDSSMPGGCWRWEAEAEGPGGGAALDTGPGGRLALLKSHYAIIVLISFPILPSSGCHTEYRSSNNMCLKWHPYYLSFTYINRNMNGVYSDLQLVNTQSILHGMLYLWIAGSQHFPLLFPRAFLISFNQLKSDHVPKATGKVHKQVNILFQTQSPGDTGVGGLKKGHIN